MLEPLTELERGILEYLIGYLRRHTYQPSLREIGDRFGLKSTKTTSEYLQSLEDKGWIERSPARSRGIRILGLELETDAVAIAPLAEVDLAEPDFVQEENLAATTITLDRRLAGSTRSTYLAMPDDSLAHLGIRERDLLIMEPVAADDLEPGDIVVITRDGESYVDRWDGHPHPAGLPIGRVNAVIRRLRAPTALTPLHDEIVVDAHSSSL